MKSLVFAATLVAASGLLVGCGNSTPQACKELEPAVESYRNALAAFESSGDDRTMALALLSSMDDLGRTALAVSETSSAREEGIADNLRDFGSLLMQSRDDPQAGGVAGIVAMDINEVCGFDIFGE